MSPSAVRNLTCAPLLAALVAGCFGATQPPATAQNSTPKSNVATPANKPTTDTISIGVDKRVQYQRIEGFGAFGGKTVYWGNPPFYDAAFLKTIVDDLGLTILRAEVPTNFEITNDNDDPFVTDLSKFNLTKQGSNSAQSSHQPLAPHLDYIRAIKKQADASGEPLLFISSIWSPPYWMKYTKSIFGTDTTWNRLIVKERASAEKPNDYKDEFAEYCVAYCKIVKQETGVDVYALSLQNELAFAQGYASAVYSPEEWRNIVRHVAARFKKEGLQTKLFGPEDVPVYSRVAQYVNVLGADKAARDALDIVAIHGYGPDGKAVGDTNDADWKRYYQLAAQFNKPLWMTETSGYTNDWNGGFGLGRSILSALKYGRLNAWIFWQLSEQGANLSLLDNGVPTPRYHASKQFYRYIRPGAVQIETTSPDAAVQVVGFTHAAQKTTTLVLTNSATTTKRITLKLAGANLPSSFDVVRSSATEKSAKFGTMPLNRVLELPAKSITTLVGKSAATDKPLVPSFKVQPRSQSASEGQPVTFEADVVGTPGITYQWMRNGIALKDETGVYLTLPAATLADKGAKYSLVAQNKAGKRTSALAVLDVKPFAGFNIARTSTAPVIDGVQDAVWQKPAFVTLDKAVMGKEIASANLTAKAKALWDNEALYVLYDVKDNNVWTPATGDADSVELIIDADNSKSLSYGDGDFQFVFNAGKGVAAVETKRQAIAGITSSAIKRADGYKIEARIPWKTIGVTPQAGKIIGLDFNVNDTDGAERVNKIAWFSASNDIWFNPSLAGVGKLND